MTVITLEFACWWFSISIIPSTFIKWYSSARESCIFPLVYSMIYLYKYGKHVLKICFLWHSYKWKILNSEGFFFPEKKRTSNIWWNNSLSCRARESRGLQRGEPSLGDQNRVRASLQHAAAAESLQSCPTLWDPTDSSPPGSPVPGILQARTLAGLPFPSPMHDSEKWKWSRSVVSDSSWPRELLPTRLLRPWDFPRESSGVGCHCLLQLAV